MRKPYRQMGVKNLSYSYHRWRFRWLLPILRASGYRVIHYKHTLMDERNFQWGTQRWHNFPNHVYPTVLQSTPLSWLLVGPRSQKVPGNCPTTCWETSEEDAHFSLLRVFLLPLLFVCLQGKESLWVGCKILEIRHSLTLPHVQWKVPRTHVVDT